MDTLLQDVRYALRSLARAPGFSALTILCLALGIGVNSTIFSFADTVSFRPLPFNQSERIVALYSTQPSNAVDIGSVSYADYLDWKAQARSFSDVAAHSYRSISITEGVESERFEGSAVTWNLFPMLGITPVVGRPFSEADDRPGAPPVVMLSHGVWQRRYLGDPSIVGRSVIVDRTPHVVIGVMPPRFQFPQVAELWLPLVPLEHTSSRRERNLYPYGLLAEGATLDTASRDVATIASGLARVYQENDGWSARAGSMRDSLMPARIQLATTAMVGAVSLVLLIACANVANLLMARATGRQREIAVRIALGAGRWRVVRQLVTESVLLALASVPLGVAIAYAAIEAITMSIPPTVIVPYYFDFSMNTRVVIYTTIVSVATGLVFGLAPALQAARANQFGALKDGGRGSSGSRLRNRTRNLLVVAEVALSLVLLVGASLFVRSFLNIQNSDGGIDPSSLMTMRVFMAGDAYAEPEAIARRAEDLVERVEALPGVRAAFASNFVPLTFISSGGIVPEGMTVESGREPQVTFFASTAHALATLGQTVLAGRDFTDAEATTRSGVALVNQAFVTRMWPNQGELIGRRFRFASAPQDEWLRVVGLVADFHPSLLRDKSLVEPLVVLPFPYRAMRDTGLTIRVAGGAPAAITAAARQAIGQSDPSLALFNVRTGDELREGRAWAPQFMVWMFTMFGGVALFLAAVGIYGVLSYSVAQRTQEFGVRVALGATPRSIFSLVIAQGARLAVVGIALGVGGAFLVTRVIQTLLYNVTPTDPISFGATAFFLAAITVLAGCVPALRATSVDPIVSLRAD